jgi:glycosyltransferase involved in cell wall biosynthesis
VVDGGSTDGTWERLQGLAKGEPRLRIERRQWDWDEPGMDGSQKAFARVLCSQEMEFLWQQDADEVVHEEDYQKIRDLVKRFPRDVDLLHLPVIELWGDEETVRTDRHSWKWRLSRNKFRITHGINREARVMDPETGRTYAKRGMSDGCEYVDIMTGEFVPHKGFYAQELELLRRADPIAYGRRLNELFKLLPSVFHYSWCDLPRKVRHFKRFWDKCWTNLYRDQAPEDRFPDVPADDEGAILRKAEELWARGGEHGPSLVFELRRSNPAVMKEWLEKMERVA